MFGISEKEVIVMKIKSGSKMKNLVAFALKNLEVFHFFKFFIHLTHFITSKAQKNYNNIKNNKFNFTNEMFSIMFFHIYFFPPLDTFNGQFDLVRSW